MIEDASEPRRSLARTAGLVGTGRPGGLAPGGSWLAVLCGGCEVGDFSARWRDLHPQARVRLVASAVGRGLGDKEEGRVDGEVL